MKSVFYLVFIGIGAMLLLCSCLNSTTNQSEERMFSPAPFPLAKKGGQEKVRICHYPGPKAPHVIEVSENALPAHMAHGDVLVLDDGSCPADDSNGDGDDTPPEP